MLSLDFIRQHPDIVREGLRRRRDPQSIDEILRLAELRSGLEMRCDGLQSALRHLHERVRTAPEEKRADLNKQIKVTTRDIRQLELKITDIETRMQPLLLALPNLSRNDVHEGNGDADDRELRRWGQPLAFHFEPRTDWDLSERLQLTDFEAGTRISGSRFVVLKGNGARLERALIAFMLDLHTHEHGYTEILPPFLVKHALMVGAGQLPKFENQAYVCLEDDLFLNPTAEVPLIGLHSDSILPPGALPLRYVAWTTAFRREAGSASLQTRGLLSQHQFHNVELLQLVEPQHSYETFDEMLGHAEAVLRLLELPYRVMALCTANLPFVAAKTVELEVWMPGQKRYVEVSSISNCETFQSLRAGIRYRPTGSSRTEYIHTVSASGLAVGRTLAAILEVYQQADRSVIIPKVLRPYMGASLLFMKHKEA